MFKLSRQFTILGRGRPTIRPVIRKLVHITPAVSTHVIFPHLPQRVLPSALTDHRFNGEDMTWFQHTDGLVVYRYVRSKSHTREKNANLLA